MLDLWRDINLLFAHKSLLIKRISFSIFQPLKLILQDAFTIHSNLFMKIRSILFTTVLAFINVTAFSQSVKVTQPEIRTITRESRQPVQLVALNSAGIGSRVSGYVSEVRVDIGDTVRAGDVLARIHAPELAAQKRIAVAELGRLALLVESATAQYDAADAENQRIQKLVASQSLSEKVSLESKSRLAAAKSDLAATEAEMEIASARLEAAEALLSFTELRAPFDGIVTTRSVDLGDQVDADGADESLFVVEDTSLLRMVAYVPEKDAVLVNNGDAVSIRLDAYPGKQFTTTIKRHSRTLMAGDAQRMRVEAEIDNPGGGLPSGLYGSASITLEKKDRAVVVPAGAIRVGEEPLCVYVVEDGILRHRPVVLGLDDGQWLEVVSGLKGDESIVVDLLGRLADGTAVTTR